MQTLQYQVPYPKPLEQSTSTLIKELTSRKCTYQPHPSFQDHKQTIFQQVQ